MVSARALETGSNDHILTNFSKKNLLRFHPIEDKKAFESWKKFKQSAYHQRHSAAMEAQRARSVPRSRLAALGGGARWGELA